MHCSSLTLKLAFQGQGSDLQWCFLTAKKVNWPGILTCFLWVIWFDASHVGWLLTHQDCHQIVQTCLELCSCLENNKIPNKNSRPITKMHDLQSVFFSISCARLTVSGLFKDSISFFGNTSDVMQFVLLHIAWSMKNNKRGDL